jgi:hypothetical protein
MKNNWMEPGLIVFALLSIGLQYFQVEMAERLLVLSCSALALYYLLSGALVLFNKQVVRSMRMIYFFGLWSISVGLVGVIYTFRFWPNGGNLLMLGFSFGTAVMMILLLYRVMIKKNDRSIRRQLSPLYMRLLVYPVIFLILQLTPFDLLFHSFNKYRDHEEYREILKQTIDHPADTLLQKKLIRIEKKLENDR